MRTHAQSMLQRQRDYDSQEMVFNTIFRPGSIAVRYEKRHPLLKRPRLCVLCPFRAKVKDVKEAIRQDGWPEVVVEQWVRKNANLLVKRGHLDAD